MSVFTSSQFAATAARGNDWREVSKNVLETLEEIKTEGAGFNLGFLYISDHLSADTASILNLFKSVLNIEHWVGANSVGVCFNGDAYIDEPAISCMIGHFDEDAFCVFPPLQFEGNNVRDAIQNWLEKHDPMLVLTHGDPVAEEDPALALKTLNSIVPGFSIGGLSSSRKEQAQIADDTCSNGVSGVAFAQEVTVATTLSQGCETIGDRHYITRSHEHKILQLDDEKAVAVFEEDLRQMAIHKVGKDPDTIIVDSYDIESKEDLPEEFQGLMQGEIHVAFPVNESDQNDYLVRNIIGLDQDEGSMTVSQKITNGEQIVFVHRDERSMQEDLSRRLLELRERATDENGVFAPKGALYVSCAGRAATQAEQDKNKEMMLIQEIIGDIPLTGFYAGGEICNGRIYGYTGILTLFL